MTIRDDARATLKTPLGDKTIYRLDKIAGSANLPYTIKILLESILRNLDGEAYTEDDVKALYDRPAALLRIHYTEGLSGVNVFVIKTVAVSLSGLKLDAVSPRPTPMLFKPAAAEPNAVTRSRPVATRASDSAQ